MTVMAIYRRDDVSSELYDEFRKALPLDAAPAGALVHSYGRAGPGFVSVDVWENRGALDRFIAERVKPACQAAGVTFEPPEIIEVETFRATPAAQDYLLPLEAPASA